MATFAYTILYVKNVAQSISFYEKTFGLNKKFITPDNSYGEVASGETTLSFASLELAASNLKGGFVHSDIDKQAFGIEIGFTTNDVQETIDKAIKNGAKLIEPPKTKPWGQIVAYMREIDGFLVEICTAMN